MGTPAKHLLLLVAAILSLVLSGCASTDRSLAVQPTPDRLAMYRAIPGEPRGDYYVGRRFYKEKLGFWGYIRRPGQPWHEAKLMMMNENEKFAYDREQGKLGMDDNYEYKLYGRPGGRLYEPATNSWYDEFILRGYEIRDTNPPSIFGNNFQNIKTQNVVSKPEVVDISKWPAAPTSYGPPVMGTQPPPPQRRIDDVYPPYAQPPVAPPTAILTPGPTF